MSPKFLTLTLFVLLFRFSLAQDSTHLEQAPEVQPTPKAHCPVSDKPCNSFFLTLFNNATALPLSGKAGILHTPIHPGVSAGISHPWNKNKNMLFFQNVRVGFYHHRFVQTGIQLYTETGYRKTFKFGLTLEPRIGVGYLHAIPHTAIFELNKNGEYEKKKNLGRPQLLISAALSPGYDLTRFNIPARIFLDYQLWFQTPFVNQYIPVLPNISLHLGVAWKLSCCCCRKKS